ncbi:hypothetical protein M3Y94_00970000 [Aphelenchoides besseyi]|nr:hypothetical protein M3Y94_00970000 [Aphelenchoides besseyi]
MSDEKEALLLLDEDPVGAEPVKIMMNPPTIDGKPHPIPMTVEIRREHTSGSGMKLAVLIWLTLQNSIHTLLIRYSRARDVPEMFYSSVAVYFMEIVKMIICVYMVFNESRGFSGGLRILKKQVYDQPWDTLKVCLPAMLYTCQNNLFYVAATHLDAATFMIVSQLKLFTTAVFSILLLDRKLTRSQWISLGVLFIGVVLVQMQQSSGPQKNADGTSMNPIVGFSAACTACTISGFAGVFFEKILKGSAPVSLWMRNVQMGMFSIPASLIGVYIQDGAAVREHGFLFGFDSIVWLTVIWYGIGGLSVAVCIKYADNIAKNFATSVAIILATIGSVFIFNFQPNLLFVLGAGLVILSIFLYSSAGIFVMRNASQVLVLRYATRRDQPQFIKTVAVLFNELIKLVTALILFTISTGSTVQSFKQHYFVEWLDTLKVGVPALIYTIQNFLLYVAVEHLDAGTFMVTYQLKILTTALFTVLMLKRRLSILQWIALGILTAGVALVQWSADEGAKEAAKAIQQLNSTLNSSTITTTLPPVDDHSAPATQQPLIGFGAVLSACLMSGFAGIYFEKILKGSDVSIWLRNVQLATFAIPIACAMIIGKDFTRVQQKGLMHGFDWVVWCAIMLQSLGGLIIAVVVKYADNILKAFATSVAIIVSSVASIYIFNVYPKLLFIAGAALVIGAVVLYSLFPYRSKYAQAPTSEPVNESKQLAKEEEVEMKVVK